MQRHSTALSCILLSLILSSLACRGKGEFGTPSETFYTYRKAVDRKDARLEWTCYTESYRAMLMERTGTEDYRAWSRTAKRRDEATLRSLLKGHIVDEKIIGSDAAYLVLESEEGETQTTFLYFAKVEDAWKITSFLDERFREAVEDAVRRGVIGVPR